MAKIDEVYAGSFVRADELPLGRRITAIIAVAEVEMVGQGEQATAKVVLDLCAQDGRKWPRRLVMNKTNAMMLAAVFGNETAAWRGHPIQLWREKVMFGGRMVDGIRMTAVSAQPGNYAPPAASPGSHGAPAGNSGGAIPMPAPLPTSVDAALAQHHPPQPQPQPQPQPAPPRRVVFDDGVPVYADTALGPDVDLDDQIPY
jgi:hypothetical protein